MGQSPIPEVIIALGANLGNPVAQLQKALARLQGFSSSPLLYSSVWQSTPVDCPDGSPVFGNAVAILAPLPLETPDSLLKKLQSVEQEFGRRPKQVLNEPRPLDLDIVAWGDSVVSAPHLQIPHPRASQRRFVLAPLAELTPDRILPGQSCSVSTLLAQLPDDPLFTCLKPRESVEIDRRA